MSRRLAAGARVLGNADVAKTMVFDSALLSTWILAAGLPELDRAAVGIGQPGEASVRVDLRVQFDRDASFAKLGDHLVESRGHPPSAIGLIRLLSSPCRPVLHFDMSRGNLLSKYKR